MKLRQQYSVIIVVMSVQVERCSYDLEAATRIEIWVLQCCHTDRRRVYEPCGVKNIVLCVVEVTIIDVHVFTHQLGLFYYVLHVISTPWFTLNVYTALEALVASRNRINSGVLILTLRTWHFPLSYERVSKLTINIVHRVLGIYSMTLQPISLKSDKFQILFSSSLDFHCSDLISQWLLKLWTNGLNVLWAYPNYLWHFSHLPFSTSFPPSATT